MKVLKFGGSTLRAPKDVRRLASIVKKEQKNGFDVIVVVSAFYGVTDTLLHIADMAARGDARAEIHSLYELHGKVAGMPGSARGSTIIAGLFEELRACCDRISSAGQCTLRDRDVVASLGERLSASLIAEVLKEKEVPAYFCDMREVVRTDSGYGNAAVDTERTYENMRARFGNRTPGAVAVATGFIASASDGSTTTLGRNGSDYTAALLAAALGARELCIYKNVDGVMSADPEKVSDAFVLEEIRYEEALELSHFGAAVLHPASMRPVITAGIPVVIKNAYAPEKKGTVIGSGDGRSAASSPALSRRAGGRGGAMSAFSPLQPRRGRVSALSSLSGVSLVDIQGAGMIGVPGIAARVFSAMARENVNVILISQASSEYSICFAVREDDGARAKHLLEEEFSRELELQHIRSVEVIRNLSAVAVVGDAMRGMPGISAQLFSVLAHNNINVVAVAQGSSERNISFVVSGDDEHKALGALHERYFLKKKRAHVFVAGTGNIGGELLRQLHAHGEALRNDHDLSIHLCGVMDSKRMLVRKEGITPSRAIDELSRAPEPSDIRRFIEAMEELKLYNCVFVDCTASDDIPLHYESLLRRRISVVTPNKKANAGSHSRYKTLRNAVRAHGAQYHYETNVGAGLPVISVARDLLASGDGIRKIEGVFSGTLAYIFSEFEKEGARFSEIVRKAYAKGYTEPDPRDDLSGRDVARKCLILARECGAACEPEDAVSEDLLPASCRSIDDPERLFAELEKYDDVFEKKKNAAMKKDARLRYVGKVEEGKVKASLEAVSLSHPLATLSGSDNMIAFTTDRYCTQPLVVRGPGAGKEVTAGGVFADIIRAAQRE